MMGVPQMMGEMHPAVLTVRSVAPPPPHPELCSGFSGAAARPRRSSPSLLWRPTEREAAPSGGGAEHSRVHTTVWSSRNKLCFPPKGSKEGKTTRVLSENI